MHASRSTPAGSTPAGSTPAGSTPAGSPPLGRLRISLFAGMAALVGRRSVELAWEGGTVASLRSGLAKEFPAIAPLLARSAVAIGDCYVALDAIVPGGTDVAIIPPVSGG